MVFTSPITFFVGENGSGKSTLLHMLGGLDRPTSGSVIIDGKDIFALKDEALTIFRRRKIGFVFQNYNLVPVLNVYENIVLPIQLDGETPDEKYCFRHATCWLPAYKWEDIYHFSETDIAKFQEIIESTAHLILEFSQEGGFCNAANL